MKRRILYAILVCVFGLSDIAYAERLEYDLRWMGLSAGTAVLEIKEKGGGLVSIVSTAKSAKWISVFYPVQDRVESLFRTGPDGPVPQSFSKNLSEGSFRRHRECLFYSPGKVKYIDQLKGENFEMPVPERIFDPFAAFFYLRASEMTVGNSIFVPVFDDKKVWDVEVKVLKKEKVKTVFGKRETLLIKPLLKSEGIFSRKGDILIWLTDDKDRIPVLMRSEIVFGGITAVLIRRD